MSIYVCLLVGFLLKLSWFVSSSNFEKASGHYFASNKRVIDENPSCPISLEDADSSFVIIRTAKSGFKAYEPETIFHVMSSQNPVHPESRRPFLPSELQRVQNYILYNRVFGNQQFSREYIIDVFKNSIRSKTIPNQSKVILSRWLDFYHLDEFFSGIAINQLQNNIAIRLQFSQIAANILSGLPKGTWILRPSAIKDNTNLNLYIRTLSFTTLDQNVQVVNHMRIIHIMGVGYAILNLNTGVDGNEIRDEEVSDSFDVFNTPQIKNYHASLFDLLLSLQKSKVISLSRAKTINKSSYTWVGVD